MQNFIISYAHMILVHKRAFNYAGSSSSINLVVSILLTNQKLDLSEVKKLNIEHWIFGLPNLAVFRYLSTKESFVPS